MTICKILEGILPKERATGKQPPPDKKLLEYHFVFACVWAFGGCMLVDKVRFHHTKSGAYKASTEAQQATSPPGMMQGVSTTVLLMWFFCRSLTTGHSFPSGGSVSGRQWHFQRRAWCLTFMWMSPR
jgi:hypothetical protein